MLKQLIIRARALLRPHDADSEYDEEVKYHVDREVERPIRSMMFTLRTTMEPSSLVGSIRQAVQAIDPSVPLYQVRTMKQAVADTTATRRFAMLLQLLFALVALALSAVGLYGVQRRSAFEWHLG